MEEDCCGQTVRNTLCQSVHFVQHLEGNFKVYILSLYCCENLLYILYRVLRFCCLLRIRTGSFSNSNCRALRYDSLGSLQVVCNMLHNWHNVHDMYQNLLPFNCAAI